MSNSLLTISTITKESLRQLKNQLAFAKGVNRQYDDKFAEKGAKVGSVVNIRKPVKFSVSSGASLNLQDIADVSEALTLDSQKHVGFQFSSKDLTLSVDEFNERYIKPATNALANKVDSDGLLQYKNIFNCVGTPGTVATSLLVYLQASQKMSEFGAPKDGQRHLCINPAAEANIVDTLKGLFQSSEKIASQYDSGEMGSSIGFKWRMDQNVYTHTTGPLGGTPTVKTTVSVQGSTSVASQAWTASAANRLKQGDVITFANVYAVNPISKVSTGSLMQFVLTADADSDGSGDATLSISPAIYTTGANQNVNRFPTASDAILTYGAVSTYANKSSPANLAYHRDAFVLGCADLDLPQGVDMAARASDADSGLSIRIVRQYDINNDTFPCRLDILYGWKTVYPELACRIMG